MKRSLPIFALCLILLSLLASFLWKGELWGLSSWAFLSPYVGLALAIVLIPQFFLKAPPDPLSSLPRIRSKALELLVAAAVAAAVLYLLRARQDFWSERSSRAGAIERGSYRWSAPLSTFLQWALYRFTNEVFLWSSRTMLSLTGIVAGVLYCLAAMRTAEIMTGDQEGPSPKALAAAFILLNGSILIFLGGDGARALAALFTLLFIISSVEFLRGKRGLALPTILFLAAILSHVSGLFLLPGYLYTVVVGIRSRAGKRFAAASLALLCVAVLVLELGILVTARQPGPIGQLFNASVGAVGTLGRVSGQRLIAALRDGGNGFLLIGPTSAVALFLLIIGGRRVKENAPAGDERHATAFLTVTAVAALAALVAAAARLDGGLRWYVPAATSPALSIYALATLWQRLPDRSDFRKAALVVAALGLFHTIPWIIVNALPSSAEKRILSLPLAPGRSEMILGDAARARDELDRAHAWYLASLEKNASNIPANVAAGTIEMKKEEYPAAISHFADAHERAPRDTRCHLLLAEALIANRWFPEAIKNLEELTAAYPDSVVFWRRLGYARNNSGKYEAAVAAYERALELEPRNDENLRNFVSALLNRAAELQSEKKDAEAEALYSRVIAMYPKEWRAYNNLATIEMRRGDIGRAFDILDSALKLNPYESSLHFNMGIVLEKMGKTREALDHMIDARNLDPLYSAAPQHIERLEQKLGLPKSAPADTQRSP